MRWRRPWARERAAARCRTSITGISIDSRSIGRGEAFFAIKGDARDGHDFVPAALANGAGLAVVAADKRDAFAEGRAAAGRAGRARRLARSRARRARALAGQGDRRHRLGRQDRHQGSLAARASRRRARRMRRSPPTTITGACRSRSRAVPPSARFAVFEMGMNHAGEIEPLSRLVQPHVAIVTTIAPVHLEYLGSIEAIADAKAEIFRGLVPGGAAVINRDNPQYRAARSARPKAPASRASCRSASTPRPTRGCSSRRCMPDCSTVQARILGTDVTYKLGAPGRHVVMNSLAVLAAASLAGADLALAALALAGLAPPTGRGARSELELARRPRAADRRELQRQSGLDAGGASRCSARPTSGARGRRIAVLGDMLELGPQRRRAASRRWSSRWWRRASTSCSAAGR